jgi:hypothetical protein
MNHLETDFIRKAIALSRADSRPVVPADDVFSALEASISQVESQSTPHGEAA